MARSHTLLIASDGDLTVERDPDRPAGRLLRQNDMDASYVDMADPRHLEFDYLRWARLVLRAYGARRIVHIGGAACTLARAMLAEDRGSRHEVIEVEPAVIEIARAHLGLVRQPGLKVRIGDGLAFLSGRAAADQTRQADQVTPDVARNVVTDAIVIDAFVGARVPRHLVTVKAFSECARLAPLAIVNVVDTAGWPVARPMADRLAAAYPSVAALSSTNRRAGNVVLFGALTAAPDHLRSTAASDPSPARLLAL